MHTESEKPAGIEHLPKSMRPKRDLWPGIVDRLETKPQQSGPRSGTWRTRAIAASVAVAFAAGILLGRQSSTIPGPEFSARLPDNISMQATLEASEREYRAAFREFIPVNAAGPQLDPPVVDSLERSWAELQQAESALRAALHEYPDSMYLNRKLLDLRSQQLAFMKQMAMLDQFSWRKI